MLLPSQLAIEVWKASGIRTEARLSSLCEHFAASYGLTAMLLEIQQEATNNIPKWMYEGKP